MSIQQTDVHKGHGVVDKERIAIATRLKASVLWWIIVCCCYSVSCDESLPPFKDPLNVFTARQEALYVISPTDNSLKVFLNLINTYEETLEGRAFFEGNIIIEYASIPGFRKTYNITSSMIQSGHYNALTGRLSIDPGDTLKMLVSWNFVDDGNRNIRSIVSYHRDPTCQQRLISDPLTFIVRSEIKVFDKINYVAAPQATATLEHHNEYFPPRLCTPL